MAGSPGSEKNAVEAFRSGCVDQSNRCGGDGIDGQDDMRTGRVTGLTRLFLRHRTSMRQPKSGLARNDNKISGTADMMYSDLEMASASWTQAAFIHRS
jgi:hypothetical protein